ncbi:hypothetical protein ABZ330_16670 [Streptomyces sp. NPDC006172]|uniref:hypothetical protein n=1 Tax=Streptomyces sp. NPDC006172 TaxID=3154470 RepID=UPI0033C5F76E
MPTAEQIKTYLTDAVAQDIIDTAAYGGITYWAIEPTEEEYAGRPEGKRWTIVEGEGVCLFFGGKREVHGVHYLDADQIREAYAKLLDLDQQYVNQEYHGYIVESWMDRNEKDGIDAGHIDAGTADVIVQLAALGEIRYG